MNLLTIKMCFAVLVLLLPAVSFAACSASYDYTVISKMPFLTSSISLGEDAPVGTLLYRQTVTPSGTYDMTCDSAADI